MINILQTPQDLKKYLGQSLGCSDWLSIDQQAINAFATLTGDRHWIHVDTARAQNELPEGKTLVHGFFALSLIPAMQKSIFQISRRGIGLNYGCNRVRFTSPLMVDSSIRLHQKVKDFEQLPNGVRVVLDCTVEVKGQTTPALIAETILQIFNETPDK